MPPEGRVEEAAGRQCESLARSQFSIGESGRPGRAAGLRPTWLERTVCLHAGRSEWRPLSSDLICTRDRTRHVRKRHSGAGIRGHEDRESVLERERMWLQGYRNCVSVNIRKRTGRNRSSDLAEADGAADSHVTGLLGTCGRDADVDDGEGAERLALLAQAKSQLFRRSGARFDRSNLARDGESGDTGLRGDDNAAGRCLDGRQAGTVQVRGRPERPPGSSGQDWSILCVSSREKGGGSVLGRNGDGDDGFVGRRRGHGLLVEQRESLGSS